MYEFNIKKTDELIKNKYIKYSILLLISLVLTIIGVQIGGFFEQIKPVAFLLIATISIIFFCITSGKIKKILFFGFCPIQGFTLGPLVHYYTKIENSTLTLMLGLTFSITVISLIIGYNAKNLSFSKEILTIAIVGLFLLGGLSVFLPISLVSVLGAAIFSTYISYNISEFRRHLSYTSGEVSSDDMLDHVMLQYTNLETFFYSLIDKVSNIKEKTL